MANTLITAQTIAQEIMMYLRNYLVLVNNVHRGYDADFEKSYQRGDTVKISKPVQLVAVNQQDITDKVQDVTEQYVPIVCDQWVSVPWQFDTKEITLYSLKQYSQKYLQPAARTIANALESSLAGLYKSVWNAVNVDSQTAIETAITDPNSYDDIAKAAMALDVAGVPDEDRVLVLNPTGYYAMAGHLTSLYTSQLAATAYKTNQQPQTAKFGQVLETQHVLKHTSGSQVVSGDNTVYATLDKDSTAKQIHLAGLDSNLVVGDVFTIADVYAVNHETKQSTGVLQRFVVTEAVTIGGSDDTVEIEPQIVMSDDVRSGYGPAYQNVNRYPVAGDVVEFAASHAANLAFHRNAFALIAPPLAIPDGVAYSSRITEDGISIRILKDYAFFPDKEMIRCDVMFGLKTLDARLAVRLMGAA